MRAVTKRTPFIDQLTQRWRAADSMLCVGLDPDPTRIPESYAAHQADGAGLLRFCLDVVDTTADLVCAFKPQIAYFAALGQEAVLETLIRHVHEHHPGIPVILDAKRGDIGDTARRYAVEAFERYDADAVTVNPYLGPESLAPYLEYGDRGVIVLCRTSNPDSAWLQRYPDAGEPVYLRIARAASEWNAASGNVMLVAGATYPDELAGIRAQVGDMPLLVPGVGAQGGDLAAVLRHGSDSQGRGLVINASRAVLYAAPESTPERAAQALRDEMRTLAGQLAAEPAI